MRQLRRGPPSGTPRAFRPVIARPDDPPLHACPHPLCSDMIPRNMFACRRHWFELPLDLRSEITTAFQIYRGALASRDLIRVGEASQSLLETQAVAESFWQVDT